MKGGAFYPFTTQASTDLMCHGGDASLDFFSIGKANRKADFVRNRFCRLTNACYRGVYSSSTIHYQLCVLAENFF